MFPVPTPPPTPISHNEPCDILVASRSMPPIHFTYSFELFYLLKIIFLIYLWVPYLLSDLTCIKVTFTKRVHSVFHRICFLAFKFLIRVIIFYVYLFLSIPLITLWYFQLVISLSNDISKNPGPQHSNHFDRVSPDFSLCNWNLNTSSKDEFSRVSLLNAHNSIHNYDISLCETSLSNSEFVPDNILQGYNYHACNHTSGEKKGGVGIFYKDSLPIKIRGDLSIDECIVAELRFGRKKFFFTVLYRNPMHKADSPDFFNFIVNFRNLHAKISSDKPYFLIFTGDFNAHSVQ